MIDWESFSCPECAHNIYKTKEVTFKNDTKHLEARCDKCDKYIGYAPQMNENDDPNQFIVYLPKYHGKTLDDIHDIDPGYVFWLSQNVGGKVGMMAKRYLNIIDTGQDLN